jgi:hypothetical protein
MAANKRMDSSQRLLIEKMLKMLKMLNDRESFKSRQGKAEMHTGKEAL